MAKPDPSNLFQLTAEQQQKLLACRAAWEEGEDEERLERLRQREEDNEALRGVAQILEATGFAEGADLTYGQTAHLMMLVRSLAPNPNLDARLLRRPGEPQNLNRDLRDHWFGTASLQYRLRGFLARRSAGGQTALQLLCAAYPKEWPLVTRAGLDALELSPIQTAAALAAARERYGLPAPSDGADAGWHVPGNDVVLRLLADVIVYQAAHNVLEASDYVQVHRLLTQGLTQGLIRRRKRLTALYAPIPPSALVPASPPHATENRSSLSTVVRESRDNEYGATGNEGEWKGTEGNEKDTPNAVVPDISGVSALALLTDLEREIAFQGFTYPLLTVRNYYLSLQSKSFALLSGLSGTGKTRLTSLFADALTGSDSGQYRLLPVRPDWADSSPLLGYVNLLASSDDGRGRFVTTPFLDFLHRAARPENAHRAFFLCLDELNLARVEHYFAEVLSAMETSTRELLLPNGRAIRLPANLFLTGTLNQEEGTHALSRKVLDRANTLAFHEVCFEEGNEGGMKGEGKGIEKTEEHLAPVEASSLHSPPFLSIPPSFSLRQAFFLQTRVASVAEARTKLARLNEGRDDFGRRVVATLTEANQLLEPYGLHFAYRVRDDILRYCANAFGPEPNGDVSALLVPDAPDNQVANLAIALDLQIQQKILPRLSGTREQIETPLHALLRWTERNRFSLTMHRLVRMKARLERDGFVSFDDV